MSSQPRRRALLIVDVQNGFCPGGKLPVGEGDKVVPIINAMMSSGYYDVIVASQDWHPDGHGSFASTHGRQPFEMGELGGQPQVMWPDHCVQGTHDAEFHPDLDMSKVDFIQRKGEDPDVDSYSAFRDNAAGRNTGLDIWLSEKGVYQLDVCGLATDYCVKFSAVDAKEMLRSNVVVRFIEDASRGISEDGVDAAKAEMKAMDVEIIDSSAILAPEAHRAEYGFGENFHTALRKGVDTRWSVILWNYINQIGTLDEDTPRRERVWPHFVRHCTRFWVNGLKPSECAKKWAMMIRNHDRDPADGGRPLSTGVAHTFSTMIELCDQETWEELDSTIYYWVDHAEKERKEAVLKQK